MDLHLLSILGRHPLLCWWLAVRVRKLTLHTQWDVKQNLTWVKVIPCSGTTLNTLWYSCCLPSHCFSLLDHCAWNSSLTTASSTYIFGKDMQATYHYNKQLWLAAPPSVMVRSISRHEENNQQLLEAFYEQAALCAVLVLVTPGERYHPVATTRLHRHTHNVKAAISC